MDPVESSTNECTIKEDDNFRIIFKQLKDKKNVSPAYLKRVFDEQEKNYFVSSFSVSKATFILVNL